MAVDDEVEQPPQQKPDAVDGQVGRAVPAFHHPVDVELGSLRTVISARGVAKAASSLL